MLGIDKRFPDFSLQVTRDGETLTITQDYLKGKWAVVFFYPEDYSFICPTEVTGFEKYREFFEIKDANLIGISTDDIEIHRQWAKDLGVHYFLGSDVNGTLSRSVGVLDPSDDRSHRATFILDPELTIQFVMVTSRNVGRSVDETIRVYHAIHSGKKCPADFRAEQQ
jgi:peroxiredoxin (alkyl hydroperoxide reductase subunit C)